VGKTNFKEWTSLKYALIFVMTILVIGCTSFDVAKPIEPEYSAWKSIEVDSLRPTLRWEQKFDGHADLILIVGDEVVDFITGAIPGGNMLHNAKVLYIEENIVDATHQVKMDLKSNNYYFWAVRKHQKEGETEDWSNYDYFLFFGIGYSYASDQLFGFHTPKKIKN
jgi:hypothetical protein